MTKTFLKFRISNRVPAIPVLVIPAGLGEPIAVERIIAIFEKDAVAMVAALGDMVRQTGDDDAGDAGHGASGNTRMQLVKTGLSP